MDKIFGDGIKKFVLMGIGAAAMTVEKSQQMVDELVKKGELTVEQGKELNQELKRNVKKTIDEAAEKKEAEEKKEATLEEKIAMMSAEELEAAQSDKAKIDNRERLGEITAVLRKHHITRGVTPGKLRAILEELGPTYVKLGQIMSLHSDVLPQRYCDLQRGLAQYFFLDREGDARIGFYCAGAPCQTPRRNGCHCQSRAQGYL